MRGARSSLLVRFFEKVRVPSADPNVCWEWMAAMDRDGYGRINAGGRDEGELRAHRIAWEIANGPIPASIIVCHKCDNPSCVRPSHLYVGTIADNQRDMAARRRGNRSGVGLPYGVSPNGQRWKVQIRTGGHNQHFGTYDTIDEAAAIAQRERERLYEH